MAYQHTTLQTLVNALASDIGDSGKIHVVSAELQLAIRESLRLWNSLTAFDRSTITFTATPGTAFYDLSTSGDGATSLAMSVTDRDLIGATQYRLMEPFDPEDGTGMSRQFAFSDLTRTLQDRRNQFLAETESVITKRADLFVEPGTETVTLDDTTIRVVRASWRTLDGTFHPLRAGTDEGMLTAARFGWRQHTDTPRAWSTATLPALSLRLYPVPANAGYLQLWTVETGATVDPTGSGTVLGVPDDAAWCIAWGALETLLSKNSYGSDPYRAQFAGTLYALGREISTRLPSVLTVTVNGVAIRTSQLRMLDSTRYGWEGQNRSVPSTAAVLGDHLALYPVPDSDHTVQVSVVRRTSLPSALTSYVSLGREQLSAVLAWAKQLALFKLGGEQIENASRIAGQLIEQARTYNDKRIGDAAYWTELLSSGQDFTAQLPRTPFIGGDDSDPRDTASSRERRGRSSTYDRPVPRLGGR